VLEAENLRAAAEAVLATEASDPDRPESGAEALLTDEDAVHRLASSVRPGSYLVSSALAVQVPKRAGGTRTLSIPTKLDRIHERATLSLGYFEPARLRQVSVEFRDCCHDASVPLRRRVETHICGGATEKD
jgi:hypothetical protein